MLNVLLARFSTYVVSSFILLFIVPILVLNMLKFIEVLITVVLLLLTIVPLALLMARDIRPDDLDDDF